MHLPLLALLLASPGGSLDGPGPAAQPPRAKLFGAQLHAGFPEGVVLSAVVRPVPWVRGSFGVAHNVLAFGIQGGLTVVPFERAVTPTLHFGLGRFFDTDLEGELGDTVPAAFGPSLRSVGYNFYSAQLGLEIGSQRGVLFFVRGGLAWVRSSLDEVDDFQPEGRPDTRVDVSDVSLRAVTPTVNLGVVWYFW